MVFALVLGVAWGLVAGYFGGLVDDLSMRVCDVLLAFPSILLAIAIVAILGNGLVSIVLAVGTISIPQFARLVRGVVLGIRETEYVEAARAIGESNLSILWRYVLPNTTAPIIVQTTLRMATVLLVGVRTEFPGTRRGPANARMGRDAVERARVHVPVGPRDGHSWPGDHAGGHRLQSAGRRPAGCAGSRGCARDSDPSRCSDIRGLVVEFVSEGRVSRAVDGIDLDMFPGETVGLVGETGCGKSVTALSILGLIPSPPGTIAAAKSCSRAKTCAN